MLLFYYNILCGYDISPPRKLLLILFFSHEFHNFCLVCVFVFKTSSLGVSFCFGFSVFLEQLIVCPL